MKISAASLDYLVGIITGDAQLSPYRTGAELVVFFDKYHEGADIEYSKYKSRANYTKKCLEEVNGSSELKKIIRKSFDFWNAETFKPQVVGEAFNSYLERDGYQLQLKHRYQTSDKKNAIVLKAPYLNVIQLNANVLVDGVVSEIEYDEIFEHFHRAQTKIEQGDYAGAITNSYTLVEELLKRLLKETNTEFKESIGDVVQLYKLARTSLKLDPASESIQNPLKPLLVGLGNLVSGTRGIANNASDRHSRKYKPERHHARLAVCSSYVLCEFLIASFKYQKQKGLLED